jgi:hypothetical protein
LTRSSVEGRRSGARRRGGGAGVRGWPAAGAGKKGGCGLEVEGEPDRWAPPVGEREREEREGGGGVGRWA